MENVPYQINTMLVGDGVEGNNLIIPILVYDRQE